MKENGNLVSIDPSQCRRGREADDGRKSFCCHKHLQSPQKRSSSESSKKCDYPQSLPKTSSKSSKKDHLPSLPKNSSMSSKKKIIFQVFQKKSSKFSKISPSKSSKKSSKPSKKDHLPSLPKTSSNSSKKIIFQIF